MYLPVSQSCDQSHELVWHVRQQEAHAFHSWAGSQCQCWDSSCCLGSAAKIQDKVLLWWLNTIVLGLLCMSTSKLLTLLRNARLIRNSNVYHCVYKILPLDPTVGQLTLPYVFITDLFRMYTDIIILFITIYY